MVVFDRFFNACLHRIALIGKKKRFPIFSTDKFSKSISNGLESFISIENVSEEKLTGGRMSLPPGILHAKSLA